MAILLHAALLHLCTCSTDILSVAIVLTTHGVICAGIAHINPSYQITKLEIFYDPHELMVSSSLHVFTAAIWLETCSTMSECLNECLTIQRNV